MNIFISQTIGKSREVAVILKDWLIMDMQLCDPWMSTDIPGGDDWRQTLRNALKESRMGILCITDNNLSNQWIVYEAGAMDFNGIEVFPYVIGSLRFRDLPPPINHLQGARADKKGTESLILKINNALDRPISERHLLENFESNWHILRRKLENIHRNKDYEKAIDDFMLIIMVLNEFRKSLNYSDMVDAGIELAEKRTYDRKKNVDNVFKAIEKRRESFIKENKFTKINPTLTKDARSFFKKHFTRNHLREIIIRLEPVLLSECSASEKKEKLLTLIRIEELEVFLRYHRMLASGLSNESDGE
jgi:hypothetical protein